MSCYRSAGSLPIPRQKKRIKLNRYKDNTVEELSLEDHLDLSLVSLDSEDCAEMTVIPSTCESVPIVVLATTTLCPALPPPRPRQQCTKHSRCHCDLLATETQNFFIVMESG